MRVPALGLNSGSWEGGAGSLWAGPGGRVRPRPPSCFWVKLESQEQGWPWVPFLRPLLPSRWCGARQPFRTKLHYPVLHLLPNTLAASTHSASLCPGVRQFQASQVPLPPGNQGSLEATERDQLVVLGRPLVLAWLSGVGQSPPS